MKFGKEVYEAVYITVNDLNQPSSVADRMMKCLDELSGTNPDDISDYLETILEAIQINNYRQEDEELQ
ncbi:hypothetical protein IQ264_12265 [Phormidium sp. LEGE 05292]|uniref:hypothetical protein n=1 Tax=[Phormidium] sp. LEGE 05292 TaxID=767427 RepID=UPI0018812D2C|nr:hypothetical protein [Phormidium sp. LEGE 05292]MBE9226200.1 hypothetical protein [Phormidium sp. LEGE 05292]